MDQNKVSRDIVCEFLEVAIHCVLYTREIYPPGIFNRKKKYNVPVQISSHPELNLYISDLVKSLRESLMREDIIRRVDIVILSDAGLPLERFVFDIVQNKEVPSDAQSLSTFEQTLRAFLLKLNISDSLLTPLPEGCTWSVQVHTNESSVQSMQEKQQIQDFTWIPAEELSQQMCDPKITPLKSSNSGLVKMQLYVEESSLKDTG